MTKITRIEVIDENGRSYVNWEDDNDVSYQLQDDGRTLKVFVSKVKPKSPVEEAYKRWMGEYPPTGPSVDGIDDIRWRAFQMGYNASKEEEPKDNEWKSVALRFGEELVSIGPCGYYEFTAEEWFDWVVNTYEKLADDWLKLLEKERTKARNSKEWKPTPQTPEETEQSLKEAFKKAQQTEEWKEIQKKIDTPEEIWMDKPIDELVDMLEKNPPKCLEFQLGKTLEQLIERWWCDVFTSKKYDWDMEECISDLIDQIHLWLPKEQNSDGTQRIETIIAVDTHNELLRKIKSKLRNKKV